VGFTLVEVIVVLVILAILAAIAIPALTGYIDKAQKQNFIVKAREVATAYTTMLALQAETGLPIPLATSDGDLSIFDAGNYFYFHKHALSAIPMAQVRINPNPNSAGWKEFDLLVPDSSINGMYFVPRQHRTTNYRTPCGLIDVDPVYTADGTQLLASAPEIDAWFFMWQDKSLTSESTELFLITNNCKQGDFNTSSYTLEQAGSAVWATTEYVSGAGIKVWHWKRGDAEFTLL
jgi:prepilin-type N-terminal cleavage/methylation domain-containing protein